MAARVSLLLGMIVSLCCPSFGSPAAAASTPAPKVGLVVTEAGFGDRSYNDEAAAGLAACRRQTGVAVSTAVPKSAGDYGPAIVLFATENYDTVIGIGYGMVPDISAAARRFQNVHFAVIDAVVAEPNVESVTFDEPAGAFLAGALAALVTKTKTIAFLGGADIPLVERSEAGFIAGAREIDPRVRVRTRFLDSFTDRGAGRRAAAALYDGGADIAFVVAGSAGLGAIAEARSRRGAYAIGVDSDQDALAPGKVLTSVVKHVSAAALRVCLETVAQKPTTGQTVLGLADGGIGLTSFRYTRALIGAAAIARVERIRRAIVAGRIVPPATLAALGAFVPEPVP